MRYLLIALVLLGCAPEEATEVSSSATFRTQESATLKQRADWHDTSKEAYLSAEFSAGGDYVAYFGAGAKGMAGDNYTTLDQFYAVKIISKNNAARFQIFLSDPLDTIDQSYFVYFEPNAINKVELWREADSIHVQLNEYSVTLKDVSKLDSVIHEGNTAFFWDIETSGYFTVLNSYSIAY